MRLAREIVTMYHSSDDAQKAEDDWQNTFSDGGVPDALADLAVQKGARLLSSLSSPMGRSILELSRTEIQRLFEQGAISEVGGEKILDINFVVERPITLRIGKHRFLKIVVDS